MALAEVMLRPGGPTRPGRCSSAFVAAEGSGEDEIVRAEALAQLALVLVLSGEVDPAGPLLEEALNTLERRQTWSALADALVTRAVYPRLQLPSRRGVRRPAARARARGCAWATPGSRCGPATTWRPWRWRPINSEEAVDELREALRLARERGDRAWERQLLGQMLAPLCVLGRWDEAAPQAEALFAGEQDVDATVANTRLATIAAARGDEQQLAACLAVAVETRESSYVDQRMCSTVVLARGALDRSEHEEALRLAAEVFRAESTASELIEEAFAIGTEAAMGLPDEVAISELTALVEALPPARALPLMRAGAARLDAERAHRAGDFTAAAAHEQDAIDILRSVGARPLLARALLERARRRDDASALHEARAIATELGARRWLAEIDALRETGAPAPAS